VVLDVIMEWDVDEDVRLEGMGVVRGTETVNG
jgi:hypothetical protein